MFDLKKMLVFEQMKSGKDYIISVQRKLKEIYPTINLGTSGPNRDGIDGVFGNLTRKAVLKFQLDNGAGSKAKGYPGKWTASKMGLEYVPFQTSGDLTPIKDDKKKPDTDRTTPQNCKRFEIWPGVSDTLSKVCQGQKSGIEKGPDGCSAYVGQKTGIRQGHAWHAYKTRGYPTISGFKSTFSNPQNLEKMAQIFQGINADSQSMDASGIKSKKYFGDIKSLLNQSIPNQSSFKNLKLGDVVGIYYPKSQHTGEAFFQGATGLGSQGNQETNGPYFKVVENGKSRAWKLSDIGKQVKIIPGDYLKKGDHFGFNTHLGFVGAKKPNGEPIVYHNVNGNVLATPLSDFGGEFSLVWARPA
jgi:peptidoglycan hydrolase-like protein with peptidoglycan-binding domain